MKLKVTHRYMETVLLTATTGAVAVQQFTCNGLFDPNTTGVGHQPLYFDQLTAIYNHYTVVRSWCKAEFAPGAAAANVTLSVVDRSTGSVQPGNMNEQSTGVSGRLVQFASRALVLRQMWDGKQYFGGDLLDNDNLQGTSAANPTELSYFTIAVQSMDGLSSVTVPLYVEIEYEAIWDELTPISSS